MNDLDLVFSVKLSLNQVPYSILSNQFGVNITYTGDQYVLTKHLLPFLQSNDTVLQYQEDNCNLHSMENYLESKYHFLVCKTMIQPLLQPIKRSEFQISRKFEINRHIAEDLLIHDLNSSAIVFEVIFCSSKMTIIIFQYLEY